MNREELSRAISYPPFEIPDFVPSPSEPTGFRPYQHAAIAYGAAARNRFFLGDQMGVGKTLEALAIISRERAFPALVVCPAFGRLRWAAKIREFFPGWSYQIIDSLSEEVDPSKHVVLISYSLLGAKQRKMPCDCPHARELHSKAGACLVVPCSCAASRKREAIYLGRLLDVRFEAVIFDESHRVKTGKADRTKAAKKLASRARIRIGLTGTITRNRPKELVPQLEIIGQIEALGGSWHFLQRYCNPWGPGRKAGCSFCQAWGADGFLHSTGRRPDGSWCRVCKGTGAGLGFWDFKGAVQLDELNRRLRQTCYIRRTKADVFPDLPPKTASIVPLEIDNRAAYEKASRDVIAWLERNRGPAAAFRASKAEEMVRIEILKQLAVEGKLAGVIDWIGSFLETGEKLVVFAVHRNVAQNLAIEFNAPLIIGGVSMEKRDAIVEDFQSNPETKLIVLNIEAGGEVIELYAAHDVAFVELSWVPGDHEQAEDRVHRRGVKDGVTAWYLIASETIEEWILSDVLAGKRAVTSEIMGGGDVKESAIAALLRGSCGMDG